MIEEEQARQERAASAGAWVIRLACREQKIDVTSAGHKVLAALDEIAPDTRWSDEFRANPTAFITSHEIECASLAEAMEASSDEALRKRAEDAFLRADAVQQQSGADIVIAVGASVALIIFAIRVGAIEIGPNGFRIRAYKSDHAVSDTVKAAAELVSSLLAGFAGKPGSKAPDVNAPPEAQN